MEFSSSSIRTPISSTARALVAWTKKVVRKRQLGRARGRRGAHASKIMARCWKSDGVLRPMMASDMVEKRPCICCSKFCTCAGAHARGAQDMLSMWGRIPRCASSSKSAIMQGCVEKSQGGF
jgi:hypothetical protein